MKATIICDNETWTQGIPADREFACLVEAYGKKIRVDTKLTFG